MPDQMLMVVDMSSASPEPPSLEVVGKELKNLHTAVTASSSAIRPLLESVRTSDDSLGMASGLSLLLVRPQLLLASLHNLVLLTAAKLSGEELDLEDAFEASYPKDFASLSTTRHEADEPTKLYEEMVGDVTLNQEIMDKVRGMESKLEYQIKKLSALAEEEEKRGKQVIDDVEEDPLSFRPNPLAMASAEREPKSRPFYSAADEPESSTGLYRPPRVAAMPYADPSSKSKRSERKAPALLSEFASTIEGAPGFETTAGLSTIPVRGDRHTNSASGKRAAELKRINEFEEENMTRLVTSKRDAKRRREDEAALALGYGVGGTGRSRGNRQNGLEAELEGVLGGRSGGVWDGVGAKLGKRDGVMERGKKGAAGDGPRGSKKARFEKELKRRK